MAARGIFWAAVYRQAPALDGCRLPAKVDQAEQLTHTKEDSALVAAGNVYPVLAAFAPVMDRIGLRNVSVKSSRRPLRPRSQLTHRGRQPGVNRNWSGASIGGLHLPGKAASFVRLLAQDSKGFDLTESRVLRGYQDAFFEIEPAGRRCLLKPARSVSGKGDRRVPNKISACVRMHSSTPADNRKCCRQTKL